MSKGWSAVVAIGCFVAFAILLTIGFLTGNVR